MSKKILIVDDDKDFTGIISDFLTDYGYDVSIAYDETSAYSLLQDNKFHLIILDINLPETTGFEICKELRRISDIPIIFASARTSETDKITGLNLGGDDYLSKPYSIQELLARVNALIRRTYGFTEDEIINFGDISVNISSRSVTKNGELINLSLREFDLLAYLCVNKNKAIPKEKLLNEVWGGFSDTDASSLTVHIRWLRTKLEDDPSNPKYLKTVYKVGYILECSDN